MKRNQTKSVIIVLSLSLIVILQSCEKKEMFDVKKGTIGNQLVNADKTTNLSDIEINNGMLVFENFEEYETILKNTGQISNTELRNWENQIGFVSQQSILELALAEEEKYYEQFAPENMTKSEIENVIKEKESLGYTKFTKKHIEKGILRPYNFEDISSLELTVESKIHPEFLNLDGMVKIGDVIYQYTQTQCKQLSDSDFDKIELLKQTNESNKTLNIKVGNLVSKKSNWHGYLASESSKTDGRKRIITYIKLRIFDYGSTRDFYYYLGYKNYKKNIWGKWKEDGKADTDVSGKVRATVQGESGSWFYVSYSKDNRWSDHIPVTNALPLIASNKTVTFSSAGFTYKRDNVGSVYRTHATRTF